MEFGNNCNLYPDNISANCLDKISETDCTTEQSLVHYDFVHNLLGLKNLQERMVMSCVENAFIMII